jgi:hypothetical protein
VPQRPRRLRASDLDFVEALKRADASGCILVEDRAFLEQV